MSYTLIERREITDAISSVTVSNIPQIYTDLIALVSARNTVGTNVSTLTFNSGGSYSNIWINGTGTSVNFGTARFDYIANPSDFTANTFANSQIYIPNYTGSTAKSYSSDAVSENNASSANQVIITGRWSGTEAINSITFTAGGEGNFTAGSSISLYGINRQQAIGKPKAIGGAITFSSGYWYHTFTGSGIFSTLEDLEVDALVVAGGGSGGGSNRGGGGGAGGLLSLSSAVNQGNHLVLVGAGGSGIGIGENVVGADGSNSSFLTRLAIGGGGGGRGANSASTSGSAGRPGGSGGGGGITGQSGVYAFAGGAGTSGQGNNGGSSGHDHTTYGKGGGGGGAGAAGSSITANGQRGNGGIGIQWLNGTYYAGGGGGAGDGTNPGGLGGLGGGGDSGLGSPFNGFPGVSNTGGGGGAANGTPGVPGSGGSGIVIIRYPA